MAVDVLKFVDSIAASPTVRLDLNDDSKWGLRYDGTSFDPPSRKMAWAGTLLSDGERLPASAYANRTIRMVVDLKTSTIDTAADELQKLFKELDRPFNILMWQPVGVTNPVFFRTFRASSESVTEYPGPGTFRTLTVELAAEPFAYGVKVTQSLKTATNDPASGSNGCYIDITSVVGDVETPAILTFDATDVIGFGPTLLAVRRRGTPSATPLVIQAESMTGGTNTTIQANDTVMSGAGQNYMRCTFGTATLAERLVSAVHPASASVDARGTYRVFLRHKRTVSGDTIKVQLAQYWAGSTYTTRDLTTLPASTTNRRWTDLGLVQIPMGVDPVYDGLSGVELPARGSVFSLWASRTSGSGNLDFDCLLFVPADDRMCFITWPSTSGPTSMIVDGTQDAVYGLGASGEVYHREAASFIGGLPALSPGVTNRLFVLLNAAGNASTANDSTASTIDITPSYYPRYLRVRPATT